ncbi:MAG: lipocalin-like domain-containing protein [Actinomycetota bacterium]|nr:lipocalin-like domain-containing protein [Actinomycetota bacterium]
MAYRAKKWLVLENLAVAAAARALSKRDLTYQIIPVGMYNSRPVEELNRGLEPADDAQHPYDGRFYWEWWYFDAQFDDGHRCVLELQYPNLTNILAKECTMLFNVYTPDGRACNNIVPFPLSMWRASRETCDVAIGDNTIQGYYPEYHVRLAHDNLACDLTFENLLPGWTRGTGEVMFGMPEKQQVFGWVVAQPRARVSGTLSVDGVEHEVNGLGYHDHNWGNGIIPRYLSHWVWGRLSTDRLTMIFADVVTSRRCGDIHIPIVFLALDDRIVLECSRAEFKVGEYVPDSVGFQVYPSCVGLEFCERDVAGEFHFKISKELEMVNTLAEKLPPGAVKLVGKTFAGPAYYRFLSDYRGWVQVGDERLDLEGETHWEYMIIGLRCGQIPGPGRRLPT